jgi:hypothetical protein
MLLLPDDNRRRCNRLALPLTHPSTDLVIESCAPSIASKVDPRVEMEKGVEN